MNRIVVFFQSFLLIMFFAFSAINAQPLVLDKFENTQGWQFIQSDGVALKMSIEKGADGNAIRFDYDFTKGTGYAGIQKWFPIDLPENYVFSFDLKASSPPNNFEVKFIDHSGDNVWWVNRRNFAFPDEWETMRIRKRHIEFAWGPTHDRTLNRVDRIEFTIASFVGGKGTIWLDNLRFEPLPPPAETYPVPLITSSAAARRNSSKLAVDGNPSTFWKSPDAKPHEITLDFQVVRELGGLVINWVKGMVPYSFEIQLSNDGNQWTRAYSIAQLAALKSFVRLPETETRYLKIMLHPGNASAAFGISEIEILDVGSTLTVNDFFKTMAASSPKGDYPRYFLQQASYWTLSGVNNDLKEALINEDGMVEVDKALFSIEPALEINGNLFNWSNVAATQSLQFFPDTKAFQFTPSVHWTAGNLQLSAGIASSGEANKNSKLIIGYSLTNTSNKTFDAVLHLLVRPFQVNPYYQFLNLEGGAGKISSIQEMEKGKTIKVDDKTIYVTRPYNSFTATELGTGNLFDLIRNKAIPATRSANDKNSLSQGIISYQLTLQPSQTETFYLIVPFHNALPADFELSNAYAAAAIKEASAFWENKTSQIGFRLPESASKIVDTWRSNLIYILMNRDMAGIQPGSRSYERSWIRDGSLTSSALMKSGIIEEVRDFTKWYAIHQYENGKVPCVVDFRGPDPVPEHDSHGQLVYLIKEYFNFTADTAFLREMNHHVLQAVAYIESLIAERSTDHFKDGNDSIRAYYGIVPESISHEGYSEKPMHSYWDNFFIIKGLKDAVEIQRILGNTQQYLHIKSVRDTFSKNLYNSLRLAMKTRSIEYLPGCVELGDFDATSTTVALTPCNELNNLPKPEVYTTFEKYYEFFTKRRNGLLDWTNYTPYENRLIGSFILLDQPERAHELIDYFMNDLRPQAWNHWAEVVWNDYRIPRFIGDMPHTWVGSDFINSIRSMFVYENEYDASLVLAAALYQEWIDHPSGMAVENLPTYYGPLTYSIQKHDNAYHISIEGGINLPANGIKIRNFNGKRMPASVQINGVHSTDFRADEIAVKQVPAKVIIQY